MIETSKLIGRNVFLNMPHSYDFRDNIVKKGVIHHEILSSVILSSYLSFIDSFYTSTGDWLALNSTNKSIMKKVYMKQHLRSQDVCPKYCQSTANAKIHIQAGNGKISVWLPDFYLISKFPKSMDIKI